MEGDINMALEKDSCNIQLWKWLVKDAPKRADITGANRMVRILAKVCLRYKKVLAPPYTLLQRFREHSAFGATQGFVEWNKAGFLTFNDVLMRSQLTEVDYFVNKIKDF